MYFIFSSTYEKYFPFFRYIVSAFYNNMEQDHCVLHKALEELLGAFSYLSDLERFHIQQPSSIA